MLGQITKTSHKQETYQLLDFIFTARRHSLLCRRAVLFVIAKFLVLLVSEQCEAVNALQSYVEYR